MKLEYIGTDNSFGVGTTIFKKGDIKEIADAIADNLLKNHPKRFKQIKEKTEKKQSGGGDQ